MKKYWCHGCGVHVQERCRSVGHRSEEFFFTDKWKAYTPPKVTEATYSPVSGCILHLEVK